MTDAATFFDLLRSQNSIFLSSAALILINCMSIKQNMALRTWNPATKRQKKV